MPYSYFYARSVAGGVETAGIRGACMTTKTKIGNESQAATLMRALCVFGLLFQM